MLPADSDSNSNSDKLTDERRGSRPSEESSSSSSPNSDTSPIPKPKPNKSRGEKARSLNSYTLPALDLAHCDVSNSFAFKTHMYNNTNTNIDSCVMINTLDLTDEVIDDIYDSICSWDETEIDSKDKRTMNIDKFIAFFDKYIYSTLCIDDDEYDLPQNKQIIAKAMFDYICFRNSDEIQFAHLWNAVNTLTKNQFIKALNVYTARTVHRTLSDPSSSPLESINEHTPLLDIDDDEFVINSSIDISEKEAQILFMEDAKTFFETFDSRKCGKLSIAQFKSLLLELYPDLNDDDCVNIFLNIHDNVLFDFEYKQKIQNFAAKMKILTAFPEKNAFLQILMSVFGEREIAECKILTYDDLNRSSVDKIVLATNIRDQFSRNVDKTGYEIESCVRDLWRWIEENGIPAIKQNKMYQDIIEKYNHLSDEYNELKDKNNAFNNMNMKIFNELNELKEILKVLRRGNDKQFKGIQSLLQNDINTEMMASMKQELLDKDVKINKLEYEVKQYDDNEAVLKYIQNNVIDKNNLGFIKRVWVIIYAVAAMVIATISFLGFHTDNKYWQRMLTVSTGFLIGFAVALTK